VTVNVALKITILVGTMTGTAQLCAQEMELALDDGDTRVETLMMDSLDSTVFAREGVFLVCTSTYGQGDVPDNARAFYEDLQAQRPDLSRVRYGVFGLGDRTYAETFNFGGKRFDEILTELGAERIGERHTHDASSGVLPEETALEWCQHWLAKVRERLAQTA
jgi:MioC protein